MNGLKYICLACIIPFLPSCIQEEHTGDAGDDGRVTVSLTFTTRTEERVRMKAWKATKGTMRT